jgi:hypothetical protein
MNADEIVRALRECGDCDTCPYYSCWIDEHTGDPADACDEGRLFRDVIALIESLQAQLAASQRRERAAYLDLKYYLGVNEENGVVYMPKFIVERLITLCGPQEAGAEEGAEK